MANDKERLSELLEELGDDPDAVEEIRGVMDRNSDLVDRGFIEEIAGRAKDLEDVELKLEIAKTIHGSEASAECDDVYLERVLDGFFDDMCSSGGGVSFEEYSMELFGESEIANPFREPAKQVFEAGMKYLYYEAEKRDRVDEVDEQYLKSFFKDQSTDEIAEKLRSYEDLEDSAIHMVGDTEGPVRIYAEIIKMLDQEFREASDRDFSYSYIDTRDEDGSRRTASS